MGISKFRFIVAVIAIQMLVGSCSPAVDSVTTAPEPDPWVGRSLPSLDLPTRTSVNPLFPDVFTGDVATLVSGDTLYVYAGHDEAPEGLQDYRMYNWVAYSTTDMKTWTSHGAVMPYTVFSWAQGNAWAAQVVERNGKFYWYVCVNPIAAGGMALGVAVSDSPTGPFTDAIGGPLVTTDMTVAPNGQTGSWTWDDIDPSVLIDDDQAYLYWGNSFLKYAKLNADMISLDGAIVPVTVSTAPFTEAPWIHKHNGTYYLSYATGWPEKLAYSTSSSPTGPWTYGGLVTDWATNSNTSHQAIVDFQGASYLFYHNGTLPTGSSYRRSVCVDPLVYNSDGSIQKVIPSFSTRAGWRIQVAQRQNFYVAIANSGTRALLQENGKTPFNAAQWKLVPGLANQDPSYVSFESVAKPGWYLYPTSGLCSVKADDGTPGFRTGATFRMVPGLNDATALSFQTYADPSAYLMNKSNQINIVARSTMGTLTADATFRLVE